MPEGRSASLTGFERANSERLRGLRIGGLPTGASGAGLIRAVVVRTCDLSAFCSHLDPSGAFWSSP
eukprot:11402495-Alexandrium_andersonii.AAC.1